MLVQTTCTWHERVHVGPCCNCTHRTEYVDSHCEAVQRATLVTWQDQVTAAFDSASRICVRKHKRQKRSDHSNNISHTLPGNQQEGGGATEEWWRGISDRRRGEVGGTVVDHVSSYFLSFLLHSCCISRVGLCSHRCIVPWQPRCLRPVSRSRRMQPKKLGLPQSGTSI